MDNRSAHRGGVASRSIEAGMVQEFAKTRDLLVALVDIDPAIRVTRPGGVAIKSCPPQRFRSFGESHVDVWAD